MYSLLWAQHLNINKRQLDKSPGKTSLTGQALVTDPYGQLWKHHARISNAVLTRRTLNLFWSVVYCWLNGSYTFHFNLLDSSSFSNTTWCIPIFKQKEIDMAKFLTNINPHKAWIHKSHLVCSFRPEENCTPPSKPHLVFLQMFFFFSSISVTWSHVKLYNHIIYIVSSIILRWLISSCVPMKAKQHSH